MSNTEVLVEYDEHASRNWSPDQEINLLFLRHTHNYARDMLRFRGHLFLNDVLDQLGLRRLSEGQLKGWLYSENGIDELWTEELRKDGKAVLIRFRNLSTMYDKI